MTGQRPLRSVLYVPGDNERAMEKAPGLPVDALIYDLEDAVAPRNKANARARVCQAVSSREPGSRFIAIRLNELSSEFGLKDLRAALEARPDALVLPKVETKKQLRELSSAIERHEEGAERETMQIWAMMETPRAILNVKQIAKLSKKPVPRLSAFVLGFNDLGKLTGVAPNRMDGWRMECVLAARAYGLTIIDGVFNQFKDKTGLQQECQRGREMGFDGKTLVHPAQIDIANRVFSPDDEQLQEARALKALFERKGNENANVLELKGKMVERLHYEMAIDILKTAKMIEEGGQ